ncbi:MAG: hypothetical protein FJ395_20810 [Verrucomicrobia bacterium]|nr:hypothetical protein [Verrucomicrobiota bacterium]
MKAHTYQTPHEIAVQGFAALVEKLGPGGAVQFIHQFEQGQGNYTKERIAILKGVTLKKLRAELLPKK